MVIDTSALLAMLFDEEHGDWVRDQIARHETLCMSTVSLAETLIHLRDRVPRAAAGIEASLLESNIEFIAPDSAQASAVAEARMRLPLNLGDCFAYALAVARNDTLLALDRDFRRTGVKLLAP